MRVPEEAQHVDDIDCSQRSDCSNLKRTGRTINNEVTISRGSKQMNYKIFLDSVHVRRLCYKPVPAYECFFSLFWMRRFATFAFVLDLYWLGRRSLMIADTL
jgi:hypothetical protein